MTAPAVTTTDTTTQTAADAAVAASTATTTTTETWTPPADKAAYDKAISDAVAVEAAKYEAPKDGYVGLKLPDKSPVDQTLVERTATIARELGLSLDKAQKTLGFVASEVASQTAAALAQYSPPSEENKEGGAKWREQDTAWKQAALVDKELGNGKPDQLEASKVLATKVLAKFGDTESFDFIDSALGSNPALLRVLVRVGRAMGEQSLVKPDGQPPAAGKTAAEKFYPHGPNLVEGDPRLSDAATG